MEFLLFVPLTSLGQAGINAINWVSVLCLPDQEDLSCVFSGQGGKAQTIHSQLSLVRGDKVLQFTSWL